MSNFISVGFIVEGTTDIQFLGQIIRRTFEDVALDCPGDIEVFEPQYIKSSGGFVEEVFQASKDAYRIGMKVLCVHTDADERGDKNVMEHKIIPAFKNVEISETENLCKNLVAVIPVQMTEAWMLADTEVLKHEINTDLTDRDLKIHRNPENYADPKEAIREAIRITRATLPQRRRREFGISEIYQIIGQKTDLNKLSTLPSYRRFRESVRDAYRKLGFLH